jgi:hypothetical protein
MQVARVFFALCCFSSKIYGAAVKKHHFGTLSSDPICIIEFICCAICFSQSLFLSAKRWGDDSRWQLVYEEKSCRVYLIRAADHTKTKAASLVENRASAVRFASVQFINVFLIQLITKFMCLNFEQLQNWRRLFFHTRLPGNQLF